MVTGQKEALASLWQGICSVTVREGVQNPLNKRTEFAEIVVHEDVPCKLSFHISYESGSSVVDDGNGSVVKQVARLFLASDVVIPAGSKISVTQNGRTVDYEKSGQPVVYASHQEILLQLFRGWA